MATDVKELLQKLEDGATALQSSDEWKAYLKAQARFHRYSFGNVLMILSQRPSASQVAGFHTWLGMGRAVRKGEHGIAILAPCPQRKSKENQDIDTDQEAEPKARRQDSGVFFRVAYVFDIAQTDGKPLPEHPSHDLVPRQATFARLTMANRRWSLA